MRTDDLKAYAAEPSFLYIEDEDEDFENMQRAILEHWTDASIRRIPEFSIKLVEREMERLRAAGHPVDVILLDLHDRKKDRIEDDLMHWAGISLLRKLREPTSPAHNLPVVACSMYGEKHKDMAGRGIGVTFIMHGGTDFIEKMDIQRPSEEVAWHYRLQNQVVLSRLRNPPSALPTVKGKLDGDGRFISSLRMRLQQIVDNGANLICLVGETGVGKGTAVGHIKLLKQLKDEDTAEVQIISVPETLLESCLFGYVKGSHSEARGDCPGVLESKKLIYLDEFQRIPLHLQSKLLRVLRERVCYRVGDLNTPRRIDPATIIVISLDQHPSTLCRRGLLDPHIAGRLPISVIEILPLRQRKDETEHMVRVFLDKRNERMKRTAPVLQSGTNAKRTYSRVGIDPDAIRAVADKKYDWPYNIAQLELFIEHLCDIRTNDTITAADVERGFKALLGDELDIALRILRRYAFDRTMVASAWAALGKPGTTYLRDDKNMNTYSVRRVVARVATEVCQRDGDPETNLINELLGDDLFDQTLRGVIKEELAELHKKVRAVQGKDLVTVMYSQRDSFHGSVLSRIERWLAHSPPPPEGHETLPSLLGYSKQIPAEFLPGLLLIATLGPDIS